MNTTTNKPTRDEYIAHAFATFTASSAKDGRGLAVSVAADTADALAADARALGLEVVEVIRHDTGRAQVRIFSFRRGPAAPVTVDALVAALKAVIANHCPNEALFCSTCTPARKLIATVEGGR